MEITRVKGIIISEKPYKESSKLLNMITEEYGVISLIAKGSKRLKSNLRSISSKLTYGEFQINYKEGKLSNLICADEINSLNNIKSDLLKISYASYLLDLTSQVLKENNNKNIYSLLESSILKIEDGFDPEVITDILELKYLSYLGISPNFDTCSICGKSKILTISVEKGGFICADHHTNERIVSNKTLNIIRMLYYADINKITKLDVSSPVKKEIDDFIDEYYDSYTGLYMKTKEFLKNIKYTYI
ncbi:MAG: DNA repair protein RecO [Bacilli bacterium]|nr:DNA repair protein RecO [Bacilli bacterium]